MKPGDDDILTRQDRRAKRRANRRKMAIHGYGLKRQPSKGSLKKAR